VPIMIIILGRTHLSIVSCDEESRCTDAGSS
jgi:hypothetical protein